MIWSPKLIKILRENNMGFCSGGDNGKFDISEVNIYLTIKKAEKQKVIDLIDKEFSELDLTSYDWVIFE